MAKGTVDPDVARGMEKLTRRSKPVRVLRRVAALARTRAQLDALRQTQAEDVGLLARLKEKVLGVAPKPLDQQIALLEAALAELEGDWIEGELTPLTEMEVWRIRAKFAQFELIVRGDLIKGGADDAHIAADAAGKTVVEMLGTQVWMVKWVGYSLKIRDSRDKFEYYWPDGEAPVDVEPSVIADLFTMYHASFTPTAAELKKSAAPMTPKRN